MPEKTVLFDQPTETWITTNTNGVYGTPVRLRGIVNLTLNVRQQSAELRADGILYATIGRILGGSGSFQIADLQDFDILNKLLNASASTSGSDFQVNFNGNQNLPYFAFVSKIADQDSADLHLFAGRAKVTSEPSIALSEGQFAIPQLDFTIEPDPYRLDPNDNNREHAMTWKKFAAATAVTFPPPHLVLTLVT